MNIYISHPFGGKQDNMKKIETIIHDLIEQNPRHTYISPIHCFSFAYNDYPYEQGIKMCLDLLDLCDEMWVYGNYLDSKGCKMEIQHCLDTHKQFYIK